MTGNTAESRAARLAARFTAAPADAEDGPDQPAEPRTSPPAPAHPRLAPVARAPSNKAAAGVPRRVPQPRAGYTFQSLYLPNGVYEHVGQVLTRVQGLPGFPETLIDFVDEALSAHVATLRCKYGQTPVWQMFAANPPTLSGGRRVGAKAPTAVPSKQRNLQIRQHLLEELKVAVAVARREPNEPGSLSAHAAAALGEHAEQVGQRYARLATTGAGTNTHSGEAGDQHEQRGRD